MQIFTETRKFHVKITTAKVSSSLLQKDKVQATLLEGSFLVQMYVLPTISYKLPVCSCDIIEMFMLYIMNKMVDVFSEKEKTSSLSVLTMSHFKMVNCKS